MWRNAAICMLSVDVSDLDNASIIKFCTLHIWPSINKDILTECCGCRLKSLLKKKYNCDLSKHHHVALHRSQWSAIFGLIIFHVFPCIKNRTSTHKHQKSSWKSFWCWHLIIVPVQVRFVFGMEWKMGGGGVGYILNDVNNTAAATWLCFSHLLREGYRHRGYVI